MKKQHLAIALALIAGAVLMLIFGRWAMHGRFMEQTDDAYVKADTVFVSAKAPGRVAAVRIAENSEVHEGDPLIQIEDLEYRAALAGAEAEVAARAAALAAFGGRIDTSGADIAAAEATLKSTAASLDLQRIDGKRVAGLAKEKLVADQAVDRSAAALKDWSGRREGAAAGLDAAKARALAVLAERDGAAAALKSAEAALAAARLNLDNTIIRAPRSGIAGALAARPGQYAGVGQRLVSVVPLGDVYVVANFKETQIRRLRPGANVRLHIDAYPDAPVEGVVESFAPASGAEFSLLPPENATGNFIKIVQRMPVRIAIVRNESNAVILPGLSVKAVVDIRGGDKSASLFAPRGAASGASGGAAAGAK